MTWVMQQAIKPKLECMACGASCEAACTCGVAYEPARERAAKAIAATPERSNRAIAAEIGVSEPTVRRARSAGASHAAPEARPTSKKRHGRDGKRYSLPVRRKPAPEVIAAPTKPDDFQSRVKQAIELAFYADAPPTQEDIDAAHKASLIWAELAKRMEDKKIVIETPSTSDDAPATAPDEPIVDPGETIVSELPASDVEVVPGLEADVVDNILADLDLGGTSDLAEITEADEEAIERAEAVADAYAEQEVAETIIEASRKS